MLVGVLGHVAHVDSAGLSGTGSIVDHFGSIVVYFGGSILVGKGTEEAPPEVQATGPPRLLRQRHGRQVREPGPAADTPRWKPGNRSL